jgi:hypothetical protein
MLCCLRLRESWVHFRQRFAACSVPMRRCARRTIGLTPWRRVNRCSMQPSPLSGGSRYRPQVEWHASSPWRPKLGQYGEWYRHLKRNVRPDEPITIAGVSEKVLETVGVSSSLPVADKYRCAGQWDSLRPSKSEAVTVAVSREENLSLFASQLALRYCRRDPLLSIKQRTARTSEIWPVTDG